MSLGYINPIAFHLFTKPIYWYGIIIATTVLVAYLMAEREASKRGLPKDMMLDLLLMALPVAFIFARAYYVVFRWFIVQFNVATPGRLDEELADDAQPVVETKDSLKEDSVRIIEALGGAENIEDVDACITRLRVAVRSVDKVDKATLKSIGAVDVLEVKGGVQAIYGAKAILYKNNINEILGVDD